MPQQPLAVAYRAITCIERIIQMLPEHIEHKDIIMGS